MKAIDSEPGPPGELQAGRAARRMAGPAAGGALLLAGILAVAFNMRAAITGLPPVYPELSAAGYSAITLSALAAVPVFSFALFSGLAPALARRIGEERVLGLALLLLAVGLGLRALAPGVLLFPGTVVASCAIALINVLLPSLVKRRKPDAAGLVIGLYLLSLTAGAVIASVIAVPVFTAAGSTGAAIRVTLGMWALPAVGAIVIWLPQVRFRTVPGPSGRPGMRAMGRHWLTWQVTAFMGLQSLGYYTTLSWFPTMFRDHGIGAAAAGNLLALMNLGNGITGLITPILAQRLRDQRVLAAAAVTSIVIGLLGAGFGPNSVAVESVILLGIGQGAAFSLSIYYVAARSADARAAAELSGFSQAVGYLVAGTGPLLIGLLHTATGGWTIPLVILLTVAAGQMISGVLAGRNRVIGATGPVPASADAT